MPRKGEWLEQLPAVLDELRSFPAPVIDRATVEQLFGVRRREAIRLMHRFGGFQAGKTFVITRQDLIRWTEEVLAADDCRLELKRRQRLIDLLAATRKELSARRVSIRTTRPEEDLSVTRLPAYIRLTPGRLQIEFESSEQLLARLFELAQTVANDFDGFTEALKMPQ